MGNELRFFCEECNKVTGHFVDKTSPYQYCEPNEYLEFLLGKRLRFRIRTRHCKACNNVADTVELLHDDLIKLIQANNRKHAQLESIVHDSSGLSGAILKIYKVAMGIAGYKSMLQDVFSSLDVGYDKFERMTYEQISEFRDDFENVIDSLEPSEQIMLRKHYGIPVMNMTKLGRAKKEENYKSISLSKIKRKLLHPSQSKKIRKWLSMLNSPENDN